MEADLAYYRRRSAEEKAAALSAVHPSASAAHRELAHLYEERVVGLEVGSRRVEIHLVSAV